MLELRASTLLCAYANAAAASILATNKSYDCARVDVVVKTWLKDDFQSVPRSLRSLCL